MTSVATYSYFENEAYQRWQCEATRVIQCDYALLAMRRELRIDSNVRDP